MAKTDKDMTFASMARMAEPMSKNNARCWIDRDTAQGGGRKHAPEFYG
ncbi:MAG TPA: hypothetical protein VJZ74_00990 [Pseudolabrys sp.]|nr:hypothetical protein [Pseudolabrys sp.]